MRREREREVCRLEAKSTKEHVSAEEGGRFVAPVSAWLRYLKELVAGLLCAKSLKKSTLKQQGKLNYAAVFGR